MYPTGPYARPVSSFRRPAPIITIDPDDTPDKTVCFRSEWTPYILGALRQLLLQTTWETDDPDTIDLMQARAQLLIALFIEGCGMSGFDVRQNEDNPCTLEKTSNGTDWTAWANLQLCPPDLILDGGILKIKRGGSYVPVDGTGSYDERTDGTYEPPYPPGSVPSGQTGNCLAAENIAGFLATSLTQVKQGLDIGTPVSTSMGIIAGTIGFLAFISAGVFAAVGLIIAGLLSALGSSGINTMLTDGTIDEFKCIISCWASPDGSITVDQFNGIYAQVGTSIAGVPGEIIQNWLNGFGPVGLSRQGHAADITTGSCDSCAGCAAEYFIDFATGDYGGSAEDAGCTSYGTASLVGGVGWVGGGGCNGGSSSECSVGAIIVDLPGTFHSVAIEVESYTDRFGPAPAFTLHVGATTLTTPVTSDYRGATWFGQDFSGTVDISFYIQEYTSQFKVRGIRFHV